MRIIGQAAFVRQHALIPIQSKNSIPSILEWATGSSHLISAVTQRAILKCSTRIHGADKPMRTGILIVTWITHVVDAKGDRASYFLLNGQNGSTPRLDNEKRPLGNPSNYGGDSAGNPNSKRIRNYNDNGTTFIKCGLRGYRATDCTNTRWCTIEASWKRFMKKGAARARRYEKASSVFEDLNDQSVLDRLYSRYMIGS